MNELRSYASIMLYMSIALTIVGLTNVFPYEVSVAGVDTGELMAGIASDWADIEGLITAGNPLEYTLAAGLLAWECVKIIIAVLLFVFGGFGAVLSMFGIDSAICALLQIGVDFLILFELSQTVFVKS